MEDLDADAHLEDDGVADREDMSDERRGRRTALDGPIRIEETRSSQVHK